MNGGVAAINASSGQPLRTLYIPQATLSMAFDPNLDEVFAAGRLKSVVVFNASTYALVAKGIIQADLDSIVYDTKDDRLFAASDGTNSIYVIDPNNNTVVGSPVPVYSLPYALLYDPHGDQIYVTLQDHRVLGLDAATESWNLSANWSIGGGAYSLTLVPERNWIYVGNYGPSNISVINASTGKAVTAGIAVGPSPMGAQYYPPSDAVLVTTGGAIYEISVSSNKVTKSTTLEPGAGDVAYDSRDGTVYVTAGGALGAYLSDYVLLLNPSLSLAPRDIQLQFPLTVSAYDSRDGNVYVLDPTGPNGTGAPTGANWTVNGPSSVLVINGTTHRFQPTSFAVGHDAEAIEYDEADARLYVANEGADSVSVVDPGNGSVSTINLTAGLRPDVLGIDPQRNLVYVGGLGSNNLSVINGSSQSVLQGVVPVGTSPTSIVYDPVTDRVYVGNCGTNNVSVINASSRVPSGTGIPVGGCPSALVLNPAKRELLVANEGSYNVTVLNASSGTTIGSVPVGRLPVSMVLDSSNGLVYVANIGSDNLSVIDPTNLSRVGPGINVRPVDSPGNIAPLGLSYDPGRAEVYVPTIFASALFVVGNVPGPIRLSVSSPETEVGIPVQFVLNAAGGTPPYSYAYSGLPSGCRSLNSTVLLCQPQEAGTFSIVGTVTDSLNYSAQGTAQLVVRPQLTATSLLVSPATVDVGVPTTFTLNYSGGSLPVVIAFSGLPTGCVSVNASGLTCQPTEPGVYAIEAQVTDSNDVRSAAVASLVVRPLPHIFLFQANPGVGTVGSTMDFYVGVAGGVGPFTYVYQNLPAGCVSVNESTVACSPDAPGAFDVAVVVSDAFGMVARASVAAVVLAATVPPPPVILAFFASPPAISLGNSTTFIVVTSGGVVPLALNYSGLPPGCSGRSTTELNCSATALGNYTVTVTVADALGRTSTSSATLSVDPDLGASLPGQNPPPPAPNPPWYYVLAAAFALGGMGGVGGALILRRLFPEPGGVSQRSSQKPPNHEGEARLRRLSGILGHR